MPPSWHRPGACRSIPTWPSASASRWSPSSLRSACAVYTAWSPTAMPDAFSGRHANRVRQRPRFRLDGAPPRPAGVKDGCLAMEAYASAIRPTIPPGRKAWLERALLAYCRLDTLAMVRLWQVLAGRQKPVVKSSSAMPRAGLGALPRPPGASGMAAPCPCRLRCLPRPGASSCCRSSIRSALCRASWRSSRARP